MSFWTFRSSNGRIKQEWRKKQVRDKRHKDFKETFRLKGDASFNPFRVEMHKVMKHTLSYITSG